MNAIAGHERPYVKSVLSTGEIVIIGYFGSIKRTYVALEEVRAAAERKDQNCAFFRKALEQAEAIIAQRTHY